MRIMIWVFALATVIWCGYWLAASSFIERGAEGWFEDRRAEGWQADYASLRTRGFPYRFDAEITDLALADPGTGVLWRAPTFEVAALAYRPGHVIALFPDTQTFASPFETVTLETGDMRASARVQGTNVALAETTAEMSEVSARSSEGWEVTLDRGLFALRASPEAPATYDIFFDAANLRPSDALRLGVDPQGRLPDTFQTLKLDAQMSFDAPWDRFAIERQRPQPTRIDLTDFDARWGQLELRAVGTLDVAADGTPDGRLTIKATNWREIISIGQALGTIPDGMVTTITRALEVLASLSGPPNTIDVPLSFQRGFVSLGPLPLGPAPKLRLR